jgi:hypothetical protein
MAKDLPYFKFNAAEYLNGEITLEDFYVQGVFTNICCHYWFKSGCLTLPEIKRRVKCKASALQTLIDSGIIKVKGDTVSISFLDQQLEERKQLSKKNSLNGSKGGAPIGNKNAQIDNPKTTEEQPKTTNIEEKREEKKRREKSEIHAPDKGTIFEEIFSDERFITDLSINHPGKNIQKAFEECWLYHIQKPSPPEHGWQWRQKLSTWLTSTKTTNGFVNGSSNKQQQHSRKLAETVAETYRDVFDGRSDGQSNEAPSINH